MASNDIFNVNGRTFEQFKLAMQLAFQSEYESENITAESWIKKGCLLALSSIKIGQSGEHQDFPFPIGWELASQMAWQFIENQWKEPSSAFNKGDLFQQQDKLSGTDGTDIKGWRLFKSDEWPVIINITPSWLLYAK